MKQGPEPQVLAETRRQALELVAAGKLMKAAGLVRSATGTGRQAARKYVDGLKIEVLAGRIPSDVAAQARDLVAGGKVIAAAKYVVQATDLNLKDAKQYVDALRAGVIPMADSAGDKPLSERVRTFMAAGDRPSAVALVCAETGMSSDEADRFVASLE